MIVAQTDDPSRDHTGRVALVTGAAGGMGTAIARALAGLGAAVAVNDRREDQLETLTHELESVGPTVAVGADVTDRRAVRDMIDAIESALGTIDILVNNAGVLRPTKIVDITEDEWDLVVDVNLKGAFLCTQAVIPGMRRRGWGRIVNLSSTAGKSVSTMGGAHYTSAKAGLLGLTRHVASEVARDGITVNAVCPGLIDTDMTRTTITQAQADSYADSFPIGRLGLASEVADVIAFLTTDRAAYITGASVDINGGDLMI
ncbi:MAG TPA: SDR family NAD(P)-dependent oxidoreductase [Acidimicrobiia bacterium]|nr:SDR family NAD(P)-dependent oxidoreductase [Acidimicrobiia bacterium]